MLFFLVHSYYFFVCYVGIAITRPHEMGTDEDVGLGVIGPGNKEAIPRQTPVRVNNKFNNNVINGLTGARTK